METKLCAIIEIAVNAIKMNVFQKKKDDCKILESLEYPVNFHEVYKNGNFSLDSINKLIEILQKFLRDVSAYKIKKYALISSSIMRNCQNKEIVIDRLKISTGLDLTILSDDNEKSYIYYELIESIGENYANKNTLLVNIGLGSIGIAVAKNKKIISSTNIPFGSARLDDVISLSHIQDEDYIVALNDYIDSMFYKINLSNIDFDVCMLSGGEIKFFNEICNKNKFNNTDVRKNIFEIYKDIKTLKNFAAKYKISENTAKAICATLAICYEIVNLCKKDFLIFTPIVNMHKTLALNFLCESNKKSYINFIYNSTICTATEIAKKFNCNITHLLKVKSNACKIFDKLKKVHGLTIEHLKILEIACILHDIGSFVNIRLNNFCSFDIIKNMDIFGLSKNEILYVAAIINNLSNDKISEQSVEIKKMSAIFKLSDSLDVSQKNKLEIDKFIIDENTFTIKCTTHETALLEKWAFNESAAYFEQIFAIKPYLTIKKLY